MKSQVQEKNDTAEEEETLQAFFRSSVFVIRNSPSLRWENSSTQRSQSPLPASSVRTLMGSASPGLTDCGACCVKQTNKPVKDICAFMEADGLLKMTVLLFKKSRLDRSMKRLQGFISQRVDSTGCPSFTACCVAA